MNIHNTHPPQQGPNCSLAWEREAHSDCEAWVHIITSQSNPIMPCSATLRAEPRPRFGGILGRFESDTWQQGKTRENCKHRCNHVRWSQTVLCIVKTVKSHSFLRAKSAKIKEGRAPPQSCEVVSDRCTAVLSQH